MRVLTAVALSVLSLQPLAAQEISPAGESVLEIEVQDRWLHGRQLPAFTPFHTERRWIHIDSLPPRSSGDRTIPLRFTAFSGLWASARLRVSPRGHVLESGVSWPAARRRPYESVADSLRRARLMLFENRLSLPEQRIWEMVPTFLSARPRPGLRWTDTLALETEHGPYRQALNGTRVSTVVRDTTVAGRRLWIVRDSAWVRYEERWEQWERTLDTMATVHRTAAGVIRGRHLYDPRSGLFQLRHDTTRLAGEATLRYPDGRSFHTPARYARDRRWILHDSSAYAVRIETLRERRDARYRGMVLLPRDDLERRLAAGDPRLRDSLLAVWRHTTDPNESRRLLRILEDWGSRTPEASQHLLRARWEAGDTAGVVREIVRGGLYSSRGSVGVDTLRLVLPFMADPGLAFAFGLDRDPFYENLRQGLLWRPPAITPDTLDWACTPEACRLLASQWERAREPRLRDLGLIAHLVLDPARWADTVLARHAAGSAMLGPAVLVIRGVGATWPAASKAPLPEPGADWRAWREWMSGTDPEYISPTGEPPSQGVRWDRSHGIGLRFYVARTGRDVVGEMRRAFETATTDSARLVFGTVLLGLGEHHPDPAAVAERLRYGTPAARNLATREMLALFRSARPAEPATETRLLDGLLRYVLAGEEVWPPLDPEVDRRRFRPQLHTAAERPIFLIADGLPPGVQERWRDRVQLISTAEWQARVDRLAGVYYVPSSVVRAGPFARLYLEYHEREARAADETPVGYAGGVTLYLLETEEGWVLVQAGGWVT